MTDASHTERQLLEAQRLITRADLRRILIDMAMGDGPTWICFGPAGTCLAKSWRGKLVLEVTAANGDCLDPTSGDDRSTAALITLLDVAEKFLMSRHQSSGWQSPWALARRQLRQRRKVKVYDAALWY